MKVSSLYNGKNKTCTKDNHFLIKIKRPKKNNIRINILALGDVGGTLLLGLKILGRDIINSIGICDINPKTAKRYEAEMNQIAWPEKNEYFPEVEIVDMENLFNCDVLVFCATMGVPPVGDGKKDVRMAQLESNCKLIRTYAEEGVAKKFQGSFFVVSDPVDPLCKAAVEGGISPEQIQGFGLGVMNGRAAYFAKKEERYQSYLKEGRVYGPHGADLVVANSINNYDDMISVELKEKTINANMDIRELGFKPYIAPAIASGAISILENLKGNWNYSSMYFGEGFLGIKNKWVEDGIMFENQELPDLLFEKIKLAYDNLRRL